MGGQRWAGHRLSGDHALKAVILADAVATRDWWSGEYDPVRGVVERLGAELGLTVAEATGREGPGLERGRGSRAVSQSSWPALAQRDRESRVDRAQLGHGRLRIAGDGDAWAGQFTDRD